MDKGIDLGTFEYSNEGDIYVVTKTTEGIELRLLDDSKRAIYVSDEPELVMVHEWRKRSDMPDDVKRIFDRLSQSREPGFGWCNTFWRGWCVRATFTTYTAERTKLVGPKLI